MATTCMYNKFFGWLNRAVVAAKDFTSRPQTSTFADVDYFMTSAPATDRLKRFSSVLKDMDILTVQIYRGDSFGSYFNDYRAQTDKPLLIGEYGADAYNDPYVATPLRHLCSAASVGLTISACLFFFFLLLFVRAPVVAAGTRIRRSLARTGSVTARAALRLQVSLAAPLTCLVWLPHAPSPVW